MYSVSVSTYILKLVEKPQEPMARGHMQIHFFGVERFSAHTFCYRDNFTRLDVKIFSVLQ